jgi:hypothetical protein
VIDLFAVSSSDEEAFRAIYAAESSAPLYRALRDDAPHRFMSLPDGPSSGVLLITPATDRLDALTGRQGFLGARVFGDLAVVHWSSPLMYARTVRAGVSLPGTLYVPVS